MVAPDSQGNLGAGVSLVGHSSAHLDSCPGNESESLRLTHYSHHSILSKALVTFPELKQPSEKHIQTDGHSSLKGLFSVSCAIGFLYNVVNMAGFESPVHS